MPALHLVEGRRGRLRLRHVVDQRVDDAAGVPAEPQRRGLQPLGPPPGDDDAVARPQELFGDGVPDSGAAPADEGVASVDGGLLVFERFSGTAGSVRRGSRVLRVGVPGGGRPAGDVPQALRFPGRVTGRDGSIVGRMNPGTNVESR
ncbi:hypothetical protein GCM10018775_76460 [Streptomyces umbrinus]|nr:hypothetical protein GCM10018775_76460 [Streptomyces umbrinus]